jgi:AraC family transcriptional regulator
MSKPSVHPQEPRIVTRGAFHVVGLRIRTVAMSPEIPRLWPRLVARTGEIANPAEPRVSYGVMGNHSKDGRQFDYLAGISVSTLEALPQGMSSWEVPHGQYAVFAASLASLGDVFGFIYSRWLPGGTHRQRAAPLFERYGDRFEPSDPHSLIEIHIPIEA